MTYKEFKSKYQDEIVVKQNSGSTFDELSREYNVPYGFIYNAVAPTYRHDVQQVSSEEVKELKKLYAGGMSQVKLAEKYHIHHKTILQCVRNDVPVVYGRFNRVHNINENYFDVVDTQDKAYILGFLYADGYNSYDKRAIRLQLTECDVEILYHISDALDYSRPLTYVPAREIYDTGYISKPQYALEINSAHMSKRLAELGVVQNKSLILEFPDWIHTDLVRHFLRGYIDGDGSIVKQEHSYGVNLLSTENFCRKVQYLVGDLLGVDSRIKEARNHNGITFEWIISKKADAKIFLDWIYIDAHLFLQRKYNIYFDKYVKN